MVVETKSVGRQDVHQCNLLPALSSWASQPFARVDVTEDGAALVRNVDLDIRSPRGHRLLSGRPCVFYDWFEPVAILSPMLSFGETRLATILRGAAALDGNECLRAWRSGLEARMAA